MATAISAKDVMALRAATGLGMMDCKEALNATNGDMEAAEEYLRKKLKGKMETRTDRAAGEGRIAVTVSDKGAAIAEMRAETDFTAKNESFLNAVHEIATLALDQPAGMIEPTDEMTKKVDNVRITTGENASLARVEKLDGGADSRFGVYLHHDGKTGVIVQAKGDVSDDVLKDIAMHVAAAVPRPQGVTADEIPDAVKERERKFAIEQAMESGKPQEIAEKIVEGKMRKLFEELALTEQPFVKDPGTKVKDLLPKGASLVAFRRWQLGESA
ncbi:MAG: translation elongation factor Ts [Phycisphaerales bacterium]